MPSALEDLIHLILCDLTVNPRNIGIHKIFEIIMGRDTLKVSGRESTKPSAREDCLCRYIKERTPSLNVSKPF